MEIQSTENNQYQTQQLAQLTQQTQLSQPSFSQPSQQQQQPLPMTSSKPTQQQCLITDFSAMFKRNSESFAKKPKLTQPKAPNWLLQIPAKLDITTSDLQTRRHMDMRRWNSVVKCKNSRNIPNNEDNQNKSINNTGEKLIAAVCSAYNYLASTKGIVKQKTITYSQSYQHIIKHITPQSLTQVHEHNRFTMLTNIIQAFNKMNQHQSQYRLSCKICTKLAHPDLVQQIVQVQKQSLLDKLSAESGQSYFVYLAHDDVFLPIGYDITPLVQLQAYQKLQKIAPQNQQLWLISSTLALNQPSFSIKRWSDIRKDLETVWPNYFDIKQVKQGVQPRPDANQTNITQNRGTSDCIIQIIIS